MIEFEKAKQEFLKYTNMYDVEDFNINRKIGHSLRVMEISKQISENLELVKEQIELATLIGLLHDIGRFEQYTMYKTYTDKKSIDHGKLGVKILEENNYIQKYINTDKYNTIIFNAIFNHNKYQIEEGLNQEETLYAKIIRDADKIDIMYEATQIFWENDKNIENEKITEEVINQFLKKEIIKNEFKETQVDSLVGIESFVYDINFKASLGIIYKNLYTSKMIDRFNFKDKETIDKMNFIKTKANEYVEEQIKKG